MAHRLSGSEDTRNSFVAGHDKIRPWRLPGTEGTRHEVWWFSAYPFFP